MVFMDIQGFRYLFKYNRIRLVSSADMNEIENHLKLLLQGKPFTEKVDFCDFTIEDQTLFEKKFTRRSSSRPRSSRKSLESRSSIRSAKGKIVSTAVGPRPTIHELPQSRAKKSPSKTQSKHSSTSNTKAVPHQSVSAENEETLILSDPQNTSESGPKSKEKLPQRNFHESGPSKGPHTTEAFNKSCKRFPDMVSPATYGRSVAVENLDHLKLVQQEMPGKTRYIPKVNSTVNYIVAAVFVNENEEFLLVEEANPSRRGYWGIPSGNVFHGETFTTAFIRVMKQETGLQVEPTTLLYIEQRADAWFRLVMTGRIVGGKLKTEADTFTLQAKWQKSMEGLKLRGQEEFKDLVQCGKEFFKTKSKQWHPHLLPEKVPHDRLYARIIYCLMKSPNDMVRILLMRSDPYHFPIVEIHPDRALKEVLTNFFEKMFGPEIPTRKTHGVLCVEHSPSVSANESDGVCITLLCSCQKHTGRPGHVNEFLWLELSRELGEEIDRRIAPNMCVKFRVII